MLSLATTLGLTSLGKSTNNDITELQGGMDPDASEVVFQTEDGEQLSRGFYASYNPLVIPEVPDKEGTSGKYWSLDGENIATESDIRTATASGERLTLTPVYTYHLSVTAPRFSISYNGETVECYEHFENDYLKNKAISVNYLGNEDNFAFWMNSSKKVVTKNCSYSFTLVTDADLTAIYSEKDPCAAETLVVFVSDEIHGQYIDSGYYTTEDAISFPTPPSSLGMTFIHWSMTEDQIHDVMQNTSFIEVYPQYEKTGSRYKVKMNYVDETKCVIKIPETSERIDVGSSYTARADKTISGLNFSFWATENYWSEDATEEDKAEAILSYSSEYYMRPVKDVELFAVYTEIPAVAKPTIRMTDVFGKINGSKYKVSFISTYNVPEEYVLLETGILYGNVTRVGAEEINLDSGNEYLYIYHSTITTSSGTVTVNVNLSKPDSDYFGRGYLIVRDETDPDDPEIVIYYSNIIHGSYNNVYHIE